MQKIFNIQEEIKAIKKDETNPFFKSKYFDINGLLEDLKPLLNKQGLIVMQPLSHIDGKPALATIVIDAETGKELVNYVTPLVENSDPQKMGSVITYFRRYALQSLFLLQAEDDDANLARAPEPPKSKDGAHGQCNKCGADMIMSAQGKIYCSKKCWLTNQ